MKAFSVQKKNVVKEKTTSSISTFLARLEVGSMEVASSPRKNSVSKAHIKELEEKLAEHEYLEVEAGVRYKNEMEARMKA
jgi:hypothetical protein